MHYILLIISTILFSSQFLFNQKYQKEAGSTVKASFTFSILVSSVSIIAMLITAGFKMEFSWFSLFIATLSAIVNLLYGYASIKSFSVVNLTVYSVFAMLGGMLLPFAYGIIFNNEPVTLNKIICCILIVFALFITTEKDKEKSKGKIYYIAVFVLNGLVGVLSTIHQANENAVGSSSYMILINIALLIIAGFVYIVFIKEKPVLNIKTVGFSSCYAIFCSVANLLALIALTVLPASVQYPIITGGTMVFSLIISLIRKENVTKKNIISTIIAFVASVIIAL